MNQWISTKEEAPEYGKQVLIYDFGIGSNMDDGERGTAEACSKERPWKTAYRYQALGGDRWMVNCLLGGCYIKDHVDYWMPLTQPPVQECAK
jgi:hypothetical protein